MQAITHMVHGVTRMVLDWKLTPVGYPGEVMTDMDNSIYPEGFYQVLAPCVPQFPPTHALVLASLQKFRFLTIHVK